MAAPADTMNNEGSGEVETEQTIGDWLVKNRLTKFKEKFIEDDITMEEVLKWDENYLNEICKEYGMRPPFDMRLKSAVRALQFKRTQKDPQLNALQRIYRVVTSNKEAESMKRLESKLSQINTAIQKNTNDTNDASQNIQTIEEEISSTFQAMIDQINERKKQLMVTLNDESNVILNGLKQQKNSLSSYDSSIKAAQKQQNDLLLDPNMDSTKRELKIIEITNNALNRVDDNLLSMATSKMRYICDTNSTREYITNIGTVTSKDDPPAPTLNITDVTLSTAVIELKAPNNDALQYTFKYRKVGENKDEDDEKKQNWTEIVIGEKANVHQLNNLNLFTKYEVIGKYQTLNKLWSLNSKIHSFGMDRSVYDIIQTTKQYPACDYNIPYVCKQSVANGVTLYMGFERYEVIQQNEIKIHLPYVYIHESKQWYRIYGGNKTNTNGLMAGKHLAIIMNLQYVKICDDTDEGYSKRYSDEAMNALPLMYYRGNSDSVENPNMKLPYTTKGIYGHEMPWIQFKSPKNKIHVMQGNV